MKKIVLFFVWVTCLGKVYSQSNCCNSLACSPAMGVGLLNNYNGSAVELTNELRYFTLPVNQKLTESTSILAFPRTMWLTQILGNIKLNRQWQLNGSLPYLSIISQNKGLTNGLGDATLSAQYIPFKKHNLFFMGGVKLPTGPYKALYNQNNSFLGTGSWDPFIGLRYNKAWDKINWQSMVVYRYGAKGFNNTRYGNFFNLSSVVSVVIYQSSIDSLQINNKFVALYSGLSLENYGLQKIGNDWNVNSGGNALFIPLFISISHNSWQFQAGTMSPIYQLQYGLQLKQSHRIRLTLIKKI